MARLKQSQRLITACRANIKTMKVEFIKRGTPLGLAYAEGQEADFTDTYAKELIELGFCKPLETIKKAVEVKEEVEQATEQPTEEVKKAVVKTTTKKAVK